MAAVVGAWEGGALEAWEPEVAAAAATRAVKGAAKEKAG